MTEDASLDRFSSFDADERAEDAGADREDEAGSDAAAAPDGVNSDGAVPDGSGPSDGTDAAPAEVAGATSTYSWSPEGGECAACGETVPERWRADGEREGELVCPECKEW